MFRGLILFLSLATAFQSAADDRNFGTVTVDTGGAPFVVKSRKSPHAFTESNVALRTGDKFEVWVNSSSDSRYYRFEMRGKDKTVSIWMPVGKMRYEGRRFILDGDKMIPRQTFSLSLQTFILEDPPKIKWDIEPCRGVPEVSRTMWGDRYYCNGVQVNKGATCETGLSRAFEANIVTTYRGAEVKFVGESVHPISFLTSLNKRVEKRYTSIGMCKNLLPPAQANPVDSTTMVR
jgi:hypothetical protein